MATRKSLIVRTIPVPTRVDILALYEQGCGTQEVSRRLQISPAWARRVKQEHREHGITRNATTRRRTPKWAPLISQIQAALETKPDLTLAELKAELGTTLHPGTLCRALQKLKLTFKKSGESGGAGSAGCSGAASDMGREAVRPRSRTPRISR